MSDQEVLAIAQKLVAEAMERNPDWWGKDNQPAFVYRFKDLERELGPGATDEELLAFARRLQTVARAAHRESKLEVAIQ